MAKKKTKQPAKSTRGGQATVTPITSAPRRQRVKVLGPNFKVRWEWREVA